MNGQSTALVLPFRRRGAGLFPAIGLGLALALAPAVQVEARGAPESFADLAQQISPSVVNITTTAIVAAPTGSDGGPMVPPGSPFEQFFNDFMDQNGKGCLLYTSDAADE